MLFNEKLTNVTNVVVVKESVLLSRLLVEQIDVKSSVLVAKGDKK